MDQTTFNHYNIKAMKKDKTMLELITEIFDKK